MKDKKDAELELEHKTDESGESLLDEYYEQDRDDKHYMGYSIYTRTDDGCCC